MWLFVFWDFLGVCVFREGIFYGRCFLCYQCSHLCWMDFSLRAGITLLSNVKLEEGMSFVSFSLNHIVLGEDRLNLNHLSNTS